MPVWDSSQYLRFSRERTQPSRDLAARVELPARAEVLDLGCGPGNSTQVLAERFPGAHVAGADNSPQMLARARADHPDLDFVELDVTEDLTAYEGRYDLVFSNACLHWVPDHRELMPRLLRLLKPGGQLAVQMPLTGHQVMYPQVIWPLVASPRWRDRLGLPPSFHVLEPDAYVDLLESCASSFDLWETTYYHLLDSHGAVLEWYRGSGLRPYLQALSPEDARAFEADVLARVREVHPTRAAGGVTLRFPRLFFVARP